MVYVWQKTLKTSALYHSFVSSSIVSGGIIVFLCVILYDTTGERFTPHMSQYCSKVQKKASLVNEALHEFSLTLEKIPLAPRLSINQA